jgi:hypothetical protein
MKSIQIALLAAALTALSWTAASAEGAIAVGEAGTAPRHEVAVGLSTDFPTARAAAADALARCKASSGVKASTLARCKVVQTFKKQCAAVAMDPKAGSNGFGFGIAKSRSQARSAAVVQCSQTAGPGRANACKVLGADCD